MISRIRLRHIFRVHLFSMTLLLSCLAMHSYAKPIVSTFEGPSESLESKHIRPHLVSNENYVEKYTFNADLKSEGSESVGRLYFSISISNLGAGDHKLHAKGVLEFGEERIKWNVKRDSGKWLSSKHELKINAGGVELSGDPRKVLRFMVNTSSGQFELTFKPIVEPWRPKGGGLGFGDTQEGAQFNLFPLAELSGECTFPKGQKLNFSGTGWGRHTWSHRGPHEWSRWSQLIRIFDSEAKRALFIRRLQIGGDFEEQVTSYALIVDAKGKVFEGFNVKVEEAKNFTDKTHPNRYAFPTDFTLTATDSSTKDTLNLKVKTNRKLYHRNPIAKLSWMKRKVVEMVTKPMEYAYEVDYNLSLSGTQDLVMNGTKGRYEVYHLN